MPTIDHALFTLISCDELETKDSKLCQKVRSLVGDSDTELTKNLKDITKAVEAMPVQLQDRILHSLDTTLHDSTFLSVFPLSTLFKRLVASTVSTNMTFTFQEDAKKRLESSNAEVRASLIENLKESPELIEAVSDMMQRKGNKAVNIMSIGSDFEYVTLSYLDIDVNTYPKTQSAMMDIIQNIADKNGSIATENTQKKGHWFPK